MSYNRVFPTGQAVTDCYEKYLESLQKKGYPKQVLNSKTNEVVTLMIPKPPTVEGFALFAGIDPATLYTYKNLVNEEINPNTNEPYTEKEKEIITAFYHTYVDIKDNHIGGGLNQMYNGGLVARLHNIADSANVNNVGSGAVLNINITNDDLKLK